MSKTSGVSEAARRVCAGRQPGRELTNSKPAREWLLGVFTELIKEHQCQTPSWVVLAEELEKAHGIKMQGANLQSWARLHFPDEHDLLVS